MTTDVGAGTHRVRAAAGAACGAVVVMAGLGNIVVNVTGARASHFELLAVYVALVVVVCLASTLRANAGQRRLYVVGAALAVGSALALLATPDAEGQNVARGVMIAVLFSYSLAWATRPLRGHLRDGLEAARFGVGLFVADQLAAYGIGGLILFAWPDLAFHSWPLSVVGELVQGSCLLLVLATCALAAPALVDSRGLGLPGRGWTVWRPIVVAALQVEFGVIVFELLLEGAWRVLHVDVAGIGNAAFPAPNDWRPSLPVAFLLLAVLPGVVEEFVFRASSSARCAHACRLPWPSYSRRACLAWGTSARVWPRPTWRLCSCTRLCSDAWPAPRISGWEVCTR
jgi:hypothetical protein